MKKLLAIVALGLCAVVSECAVVPMAQAQSPEVPLFSLSRLQIGAGANYEWFSAEDGAQPFPFQKEWTIGLYSSYNVIPQLDVIGFSKYGLDNKVFNSALGLRVVLFAGSEQ